VRLWIAFIFVMLGVSMAVSARADEGISTGPSRVDFDDRLIKGQRQGTGSVYIFERQKVDLKSMVKKMRSFRERIVLTVFEE
jgi:hypothetical protein